MIKSRNTLQYKLTELSVTECATTLAKIKAEASSEGSTVVRLVFLGGCSDNGEYASYLEQMRKAAAEMWGEQRPIVTFVAQPALGAELYLEVHSIESAQVESIEYSGSESKGRYINIGVAYGQWSFVGEVEGDVVKQSIEEQSKDVFTKASKIFNHLNINAKDIIRQWNYIERIVDMEGENQHYQLFNNARSDFYATSDWSNGYPAATGIGADFGGIAIDFDILTPKNNKQCIITPIDNKLQVAAHVYSEEVLINANCNKSTPKFERAKSIEANGVKKLIYISGTAAIRGELSLTDVSAAEQTVTTLENIEQLIDSPRGVELFRAYVKFPEDYKAIREVVEQRYPGVVTSYIKADVCRDELLIEIEGISQL